MGALQRGLGEQDSVIGENGDRVAAQPGERASQRRPVAGLELLELGTVDDACNDLAHVVDVTKTPRNDSVNLFRGIQRILRCRRFHPCPAVPVQVTNDAPREAQRVAVVLSQIVGDAGYPGVQVSAAQRFGVHLLSGRRLHQGRAAEEYGSLVLDDDGLVAHRRNVGAARRTRPHDHRHLRDVARRQPRLVVENSPEVFPVGKDFILHGQIGAAGIGEIYAGKVVFERDLLGAQVLLDRERIVGAALDRGVVGDNHAFRSVNPPDAADQTRRGHRMIVDFVGGELADFEERGAGIDQHVHAVADQHLAAPQVPCARGFGAAQRNAGLEFLQPGRVLPVDRRIGCKLPGPGICLGLEYRHRRGAPRELRNLPGPGIMMYAASGRSRQDTGKRKPVRIDKSTLTKGN